MSVKLIIIIIIITSIPHSFRSPKFLVKNIEHNARFLWNRFYLQNPLESVIKDCQFRCCVYVTVQHEDHCLSLPAAQHNVDITHDVSTDAVMKTGKT